MTRGVAHGRAAIAQSRCLGTSVSGHSLRSMSKASSAQLIALARIKLHGLNVWTGDPFDGGAMATLDAPPPSYETISIATVRKLIRQGWISALSSDEEDRERDTIWVVTPKGNQLLNRHSDYLELASREAAHIQTRALAREISMVQRPEREAELREWGNTIEWTAPGLRGAGFQGFVPFVALPESRVPRGSGIYTVLRLSNAPVAFREQSVAGLFKGKSPNVDIQGLENKWVPGVPVLYIGKAQARGGSNRGLAKRLDEYRRYGSGESIGHWGGRYIWQLEDSADLVVAWMETPHTSPEDVESALLASFISRHGVLPFANLKRGRTLTT